MKTNALPEHISYKEKGSDPGKRFLLLRISIAIIFIWFGVLKLFGVSPVEELIAKTVFWFSADWFIPFLGLWECLIGLLFLFRETTRFALLLIFLMLPGTFLPFIVLPEVTFSQFPFELTLEGEFILKNLMLAAGAITIGKGEEINKRSS